ncbi:hypothetical protein EV199_1926 [Pseudobacter ginsenosidimutans]|uniref:Uncharacterized protein n=1 Tax=Pseudobacter ginsenosidimutans TaxID=661488 RepID=A0A4Q7N4W0_9BACT|nr:hypothetical protein EV199_1926 [Pseudobacter ginsenosidimutans]
MFKVGFFFEQKGNSYLFFSNPVGYNKSKYVQK